MYCVNSSELCSTRKCSMLSLHYTQPTLTPPRGSTTGHRPHIHTRTHALTSDAFALCHAASNLHPCRRRRLHRHHHYTDNMQAAGMQGRACRGGRGTHCSVALTSSNKAFTAASKPFDALLSRKLATPGNRRGGGRVCVCDSQWKHVRSQHLQYLHRHRRHRQHPDSTTHRTCANCSWPQFISTCK